MMQKKIKYKKEVKNKTGLMLFLLFTCFTLCLSVGYAALNSELKISGEANFRVQKDIRIEDVKLYETTNLAIENYTSKYSKDTITLGVVLKQIDSTISYKVKVQNNGTVAMWIDSIENNTNNSNMEYVLDGIGLKELISPGEEKEFIIKIKYKDSVTVLPDNTNIDTILKFNFIKPESTLAMGNNKDQTSTFFNGTIKKEEVESIEFRPTLDVIEDAIGYWDASQSKNGTVIASYTDTDGNGLYELYIGGIGIVNAPINSTILFFNFTNLKTINFGKYFDTSNVTSMFGAFRNCNNLLNLDLSNFNTSKVTNMSNMFNGCRSLIELDVSNFDTSNVTTMEAMFMACNNLININIIPFNTSKVTAIRSMFNGCNSLTSLDVSNFDTSNATDMADMFYGCSSLTDLNLLNFDTFNVTNMSGMFWECSKLTSLDLSSFDISNVTNMSWMFGGMSSLTSLDLSNFNTKNITNMSWMFRECKNLTELDLSSFDTSKVTNMDSLFMNDIKLVDLNISSFDTSNVTNMSYMFRGCSSLTDLNLLNFDTFNVTNMASMFYGCSSLTNLNISSFDTSNVTNMSWMFGSMSSLTSLDLSSFDFSNVTNSSGMFTNFKVNSLIYVKDEASKEFILNARSDLSNVQIKEVR